MVRRLSDLRDEAERAGFSLLAYFIEVALVEAERIAQERDEPSCRAPSAAMDGVETDGTARADEREI